MKRIAAILWVLVVALCVLAVSGRATKIIYQSPKELARESSQIVRGKVAGVRSFWNESRSKIFTEVLIAVEETYKGTALGEARVLQLGGIVGNVNVHVDGALSWKPNEEVLLFLEPNVPGTYAVAGFSQGKFAIERDRKTGKAFVRAPGLEGVELVGKAPGSVSAPPRRMSLDSFISQTVESE